MSLNELSTVALYYSADELINISEYDKAIILLKEYIENVPTDINANIKLAYANYKTNNYFEAYYIITDLINNYPEINQLFYLKGLIMLKINENIESYICFKHIIDQNKYADLSKQAYKNINYMRNELKKQIEDNKLKSDIIISNISKCFHKILYQQIIKVYTCPLTQNIMIEPVLAEDGYLYDKCAIESWIINGNNYSPLTNKPFNTYYIEPIDEFKEYINSFLI
jgi:tetratricopeptide (TPR) repeat protein